MVIIHCKGWRNGRRPFELCSSAPGRRSARWPAVSLSRYTGLPAKPHLKQWCPIFEHFVRKNWRNCPLHDLLRAAIHFRSHASPFAHALAPTSTSINTAAMGKILKFSGKRRRMLRRYFPSAYRKPTNRSYRPRWRWGYPQAMLATMGVALGGLGGLFLIGDPLHLSAEGDRFSCSSVRIIDGDTFDCGSTRIRMQGIDAPEMPGHCRQGRNCTPGDPWASTANLRRLTASGSVTCRRTDTDRYGRTVARCYAGQVDLSCRQVEDGQAVRRYSAIWC